MANEFDQNGEQRDQAADRRDQAGDRRDQAGEQRDQAGDQRDQDAEQRDEEAVQRDEEADRADRAADQRDRSEALELADATTDSNRLSALNRREAAADRRRALHDRQEAAGERTQAELDRGIAMADREAGARGRGSAELDRGTALADRASSARDRNFHAQLAASLQFGWTVRQLDPPEFLYVSPGYLKIMGLDPRRGDLSSAEEHAMMHHDDVGRVPAEYWNLATPGRPAETDMRIVRPAGDVRWIRSTCNAVTDADGTVSRVATKVEDITAAKAGEEAARSSQHEAERANAAKSELLFWVSHELRTPVDAVLGFAQLLELETLSEAQASAVGHILGGGWHLAELINDLLDLSRIESNQPVLSIELVRVTDVLTDIVGLMKPTAKAVLVELNYDPSDPAARPYVLANNRRLRQVLLNLVSNAINFNQQGGRVDVSYQLVDEGHLRISITDTGIGIRDEDLPRLFTPFDRLGHRSDGVEGTGIGLALSQRLVEIMGGRLEVESEVDVGSTFSVILPLIEFSDGQPSRSDTDKSHEALPPILRSTLLYIENNLSSVELVQGVVHRRPGWTLVHAGHGARGIELAGTSDPSLILLDLHLPDMHGIDVLLALRASPRTAGIPLVVVSADANPHQIRRPDSDGAEQYLTKPLNVNDVLSLLDLHARRPKAPHGC